MQPPSDMQDQEQEENAEKKFNESVHHLSHLAKSGPGNRLPGIRSDSLLELQQKLENNLTGKEQHPDCSRSAQVSILSRINDQAETERFRS